MLSPDGGELSEGGAVAVGVDKTAGGVGLVPVNASVAGAGSAEEDGMDSVGLTWDSGGSAL